MSNIDKELDNKRKELNNIDVPDELESLLRESLDSVPNKRKRFNIRSKFAALIIVVLLIGYNADTLADYGKKLIGYDNVMTGTLQELNRLEKGQLIDRSFEFQDRSKITLDGIMLDDNNLVVFYSFYNPNKSGEDLDDTSPIIYIESSRGKTYSGGGQGELSKDGKEIKWVMTYDSPSFFEKDMNMTFNSTTTGEEGKIKFELDKDKAMGKSLKVNIDKKINIENRSIKVKSLIASPISTVIKGEFQNIFELAIDQIRGEKINFGSVELELLADGAPIEIKSSGNSTNLKGSYFNFSFDALPKNTTEVELKLKSLGVNETVNQKISVDKGKIDTTITILGQDIIINEVYEGQGNTYIDITTEESIYLRDFDLNIDGQKVNQEQTIEGDYIQIIEDAKPKYLRNRTIEFKGTGANLELDIKNISYVKYYDKSIYHYKIK